MVYEAAAYDRTWFVSLTYRSLPEAELHPYKTLQDAIKRLRKAGIVLRYIVTPERGLLHGRFHWHMLIHGSATLKWRDLASFWPAGFAKVKLAQHRHMRYVAKYIKKGDGRVRCSQQYGHRPLPLPTDNPIFSSVLEHHPDAICTVHPVGVRWLPRKLFKQRRSNESRNIVLLGSHLDRDADTLRLRRRSPRRPSSSARRRLHRVADDHLSHVDYIYTLPGGFLAPCDDGD